MKHLQQSVSILALTMLGACGGGGVNSAGSQSLSPSAAPTAPVAATPTTPVATTPTTPVAAAPTTPATGTPVESSAGTPATDGATPVTSTPVPTTIYAAPVAPAAGTILTPSAKQPVRSANDTAEFRQNYIANELVDALYALDNGWTGQGVTVGVLDDGVNTDLAAMQGQISDLSKDFGTVTRGGVTTARNAVSDDKADHGTAVAAIIAARQDGSGTVGIAPAAKIAILRTSDYNYDTNSEVLNHDGAAIDYAATAGIKVVNRSLASEGFNDVLRGALGRYATAGGLLVNAAGNSGGADPADAVNVDAANRAAWLFVVALDPQVQTSYALASYSNKAGSLADRTVTAAGTNYTTKIDGSVAGFSGTSSATAQVTGLAALILSKWPQISGADAGKVILNTARDIGAPGVDATFGHGLIDVRAALSPINPTISNGAVQTSLADTAMALPAAIGEGSIQTALASVTVLDQYGRDFTGSVAGLVVKPESGRAQWLRRRLGQMANGGASNVAYGPLTADLAYASYRFGPDAGEVRSVLTSGEIGYRAGATGFRLGFNAQDSLQSDIMGLAPFANGVLAYAPQAGNSLAVDQTTSIGRLGLTLSNGAYGRSRAQAATVSLDTGHMSLRASWIDETGSVMGVVSTGGLALGRGAQTALIEAHRSVDLAGGWRLEGYGSIGITRLKIDAASVVTGASSLVGTRAGAQASRAALGGTLSFGLAQPLTIERGRANLVLGSGYDLAAQSLTYRAATASLASGVRRLQMTAGFAHGTARSSFRVGLMQDLSDGSTRALAGYSTRF